METAFLIRAVFPQRLVIGIRGEDVLYLDQDGSQDEDTPIPDLGMLFARATSAGLFGGRTIAPEACNAKVEKTDISLDQQTATWTLRLDGMDPGGFRVMANVLKTRTVDSVKIMTDKVFSSSNHMANVIDVNNVSYPESHQPCPFMIDYEPPMRSKDRVVQVEFESPPPEQVVDDLLSIFDLWSQLLMLGGYPEIEESHEMSGAFPEPPFQLDEVTVEQAFPELFSSDEASFNAIVNYAQKVHRSGDAISKIRIR
jgi:hypothetical protein